MELLCQEDKHLMILAKKKNAFLSEKKAWLGVLSISGKRLNFLDLELKENSRKIKLLEIGLEEIKSVDTNICAQKITKPYSYSCQLYLH